MSKSPRVFRTASTEAWNPGDEVRGRSRLLAALSGWGFSGIEEMHEASVRDPERFWPRVVADLDIEFGEPFEQVLDESEGRAFPRWFPGGRLNAATLCVHRHAEGGWPPSRPSFTRETVAGGRSVTYGELDTEVRRFAAALTALGIGRGDRVILFLPVVPEAVAAFLGCATVGGDLGACLHRVWRRGPGDPDARVGGRGARHRRRDDSARQAGADEADRR